MTNLKVEPGTQARATTQAEAKVKLIRMGDQYLQTAEAMQRERPVIAHPCRNGKAAN